MMKVYNNVTELIGNTPLVRINNLNEGEANVFVKVEFFNPGGSVKDRIALNMINQAMAAGLINEDTKIIEPTSGNTGIGLALVAAAKNLDLTIVMPESMSIERRKMIASYGAKLVLSPASEGMSGAIKLANELAAKEKSAFIPQQFENENNPAAHYASTGKEIYEALDGAVDLFVAGVGTGGTISGVGKYLKEQNPQVKLVAVEPEASQVLAGKPAGKHKIQGIGAGFVPKVYANSIIDEIIPVSDDNAISTSQQLSRQEGLGVGISSGAATYAALQLAKRPENKGKNIVVLLPDTSERYLSTDLFNF